MSKGVGELQALSAVGELVAQRVVGECAYLRKVGAVPGLHRGEAVARMGEGEHPAQAGSAVAVKTCDVPVPVVGENPLGSGVCSRARRSRIVL